MFLDTKWLAVSFLQYYMLCKHQQVLCLTKENVLNQLSPKYVEMFLCRDQGLDFIRIVSKLFWPATIIVVFLYWCNFIFLHSLQVQCTRHYSQTQLLDNTRFSISRNEAAFPSSFKKTKKQNEESEGEAGGEGAQIRWHWWKKKKRRGDWGHM